GIAEIRREHPYGGNLYDEDGHAGERNGQQESEFVTAHAHARSVGGRLCKVNDATNLSGRYEMKLHSVGMSVIALGLSLVAAVAQAQAPSVGRASRITGDQISSAQAPGAPVRKLAEGDSLFAGERIRTGAGTVLQIDFTDKSRMT